MLPKDEQALRALRGGGLALACSLLAHALIALSMLQLHVPHVPTHPPFVSHLENWSFMEPWRSVQEGFVVDAASDAHASGASQPMAHARRGGMAEPMQAGTSEALAGAAESAASSQSSELAPPSEGPSRDDLVVLIAPGHVAAAFAVRESSGPAQLSGPASLHATGGMPALATEAEVEASLSRGLRTEIMARPWLSHTSPRLVRSPDGAQVYTGHAFTATIRPDGSVDFADRGAVDAEGMIRGEPMRFDMADMAMRSAGQDPYSAEREWFMEETEEVRAALEAAEAERLRAEAMRRVPGRLALMWSRATPASIRRRAIFRMWDECDEQGDGATVRAQVIAFVREAIPELSEEAFTVEELRRWNAERESEAPFEPYL